MTTEMDSDIPSCQPRSTMIATVDSTVIATQYVANRDMIMFAVVSMRMANAKASEMTMPCIADMTRASSVTIYCHVLLVYLKFFMPGGAFKRSSSTNFYHFRYSGYFSYLGSVRVVSALPLISVYKMVLLSGIKAILLVAFATRPSV